MISSTWQARAHYNRRSMRGVALCLCFVAAIGCAEPPPTWTWVADDWSLSGSSQLAHAGDDRHDRLVVTHSGIDLAAIRVLDGDGVELWKRVIVGTTPPIPAVFINSVAMSDEGTIYIAGDFNGPITFDGDTTLTS